MRSLDVLEILTLERDGGLEVGDASAMMIAARAKAAQALASDTARDAGRLADRIERSATAYGVFRHRHRLGPVLNQLSEVSATQFDDAELRELQDLVLGDLNAARIAIETLPSSNVRIGVYHDISEHHLFRWLGLTGETPRNEPMVCVGSDDTGIFATSLRDEYAAVWSVLCRHMGSSAAGAERIITSLNDNGWNRRFQQRA